MPTTPGAENLAAKEFSLIQEIARRPARTQRDLSERLGLSLGMTNLLIKRLARKGLIKVKALDWNRTQYLLTLKGAMEKARKSYDYSRYTIRIFRQIRENIAWVLKREHASGARDFAVVAQDEILELIQDTVRELSLPGARFLYARSFAELPREARLVLNATPGPNPPPRAAGRCITLVDFDNIDFRIR